MANSHEILLLDGGFGGQLSRHVEKPVDGHPLWTARFLHSDPEAIIKTHLDFLNAGSEAISTNTYQASVCNLMEHLEVEEDEAIGLIKKGVKLAKEARDKYLEKNSGSRRPLIIGSVGPYGAILNDGSEYTGNYADKIPEEVLTSFHLPRIKVLVDEGVDMLAFETIPCRREAEVLVQLLKEFPGKQAWLSFSCKDDGLSLAHGENFQETARFCYEMNREQIAAVGVNCLAPESVEKLLSGINDGREKDPIPLVAYPNSGEKFDKEWIGKENCKPIQSFVSKWLDLGIKYVGGCCRVYSEDISKIRSEIDNWKNTNQNSNT